MGFMGNNLSLAHFNQVIRLRLKIEPPLIALEERCLFKSGKGIVKLGDTVRSIYVADKASYSILINQLQYDVDVRDICF